MAPVPREAAEQVFSELANVVVAYEPALGFVAVGPHTPHGAPPRLRAWDFRQKRVLWEAFAGQTWLADLPRERLAVVGRNVYVANGHQMVVCDLASGARKWGASLSDVPGETPDGSLAVADPFPVDGRGAVVVPTIDHQLWSFDRDTGQPLWSRSFGDKAIEVEAVAPFGACLVRYGAPFVKVDIVNPAYAQPIAQLGQGDWSTDLGRCRVAGRNVFTIVDDYGPSADQEGLLGFDAVSGQVHFFDEVDGLEEDTLPVAAGAGRVFAATSDGEGIYVGPRGRTMPSPVPGHGVAAFVAAGPTLVLLLKKLHGTPMRRVVGVDPATLAFRFDAGTAGPLPDGDWDRQVVSDGFSVVFVVGDGDGRGDQLRSVDATSGRLMWSAPIGAWASHAFLGGHVLVRSADQLAILAPSNGQRMWALPVP